MLATQYAGTVLLQQQSELCHVAPVHVRRNDHGVVVGKVADEILRVAIEERTNLIIMGIQGKKGWRRMYLDGVSEKVIQRSSIPVMTLWIHRGAAAEPGRARHLVLTD
jgi:nucleotide-binding universal stress UspA family protein